MLLTTLCSAPLPAVFLNIAFEMPLPLAGLLILTIDLLTEQVCASACACFLRMRAFSLPFPYGFALSVCSGIHANLLVHLRTGHAHDEYYTAA